MWRALGSPVRRSILDRLAEGPRTTSQLAESFPELSRFAVMQHLGVLTEAGLVLVRRRGRFRFNHLNPVPLREWYQRWVAPMLDTAAAEMLSLHRHVEERQGDEGMSGQDDVVRTVRIETELRFSAPPGRVFSALTDETLEWFPHTYGEERVVGIVVEPRVGGLLYEDWGEGRGYLYGEVVVYDPPRRYATRGRVMPGTILDSEYVIEPDGEGSVLRASKVAVGPMTEDEAASIHRFGDLAMFEDELRRVVETG
jgi:DNA-binding transcriptional ArsR family regulator